MNGLSSGISFAKRTAASLLIRAATAAPVPLPVDPIRPMSPSCASRAFNSSVMITESGSMKNG